MLAIIATMVALSTVIDLAQTHRSVTAMSKLRAQVSTQPVFSGMEIGKKSFGAMSSLATSFGFRPVTSFPLTHA